MTTSIPEWLEELGLGRYAALFVDNEVDLATLKVLSDTDLKELGLPFGPRKRLLAALRQGQTQGQAQGQATQAQAPAAEPPKPVATAEGERRQLTVLFCDLVGFTELTLQTDPELLETIIRNYEDACAACIGRYDGFIYRLLGDGILAFFGFPLAHEGEASRAIRAGLEIVDTISRMEVPEVGRLKVRIGIATGIVVVAPGKRNVLGETMNLAARLQGVAPPDSVVVSDRVFRLAGGEFDYETLGALELKGIVAPTRAYRVVGVSAAASRFDAAVREKVSPLVGRAQEMEGLLRRWQSVNDRSSGQAVLLSGEPGVGKSRIASALLARLEAEGAPPLRFQCSPFYVNSAFYPFSAGLERMLDFGRDEPPEARLDKLETLVVRRYGLPPADVRFIAAILSLPHEERYGPLAMSPRLLKEATIRVLVDVVKAVARVQPCLLLFEDVHWADPTTLETLSLLMERLYETPLLVVLTHRPEFDQPWSWSRFPYVSALDLARLAPAQSWELISNLTDGKELPADLVEQIIAKTDGVPLFIEELTKAIVESGDLIDQGDRYVYARPFLSVSIPETLRDSLMARLDRVAAVKRVAQVGSVIGREFGYELLAEVETMSETALAEVLARLVASELASCRGEIPTAVYTFKHALVQDTAYDSLLKSQRMTLHGKIAETLEKRWPESRDTKPELLAHHYTAAGLFEQATPYWRRAGELAMQRFALTEAITHLNNGMSLIGKLPPGPQRDLMELELRTVLGPAVVAQHGWGQGEVSRILEPAWLLAESLDHRPAYAPVLHSLWVHYLCVDQLGVSLATAEKLLAAGAAAADDGLESVGHRAAVGSHYWLGNFTAARRYGDALHALYDPKRHWHIAQLTNTDPLTGDGIYRGQYLWMLGYPDQARRASDAKDEHARWRNHPFDLAFALTLGAQVFDYLCEPDELRRRTDEAERICRAHGVALLGEIMVEISRGIVSLRAGLAADAVGQLDRAIGRLAATGHRVWLRYLRGLQGEALALTGDLAGALALIEESIAQTERGEERVHYAELLRLRGSVLLSLGRSEEAEASLCAAIDVARSQQAKSWELRAATTLARLLAERGDRKRAREALADVYGWFTEGFGTRDLRAVKALLDELQD
jgi:class 3 adenylate cyclase/tetratricopeptide (TPR) repeat protein